MINSNDCRPAPLFRLAIFISICLFGPCNQFPLRAQSNVIQGKFVEQPVRVAQDFSPASAKPNSPFQKPAAYKTVATNLRQFGVPFQINAADDSFIEVQLYLSRDQGKTWRFHARQATDQREFPFQAQADGEYWFSLKTLNRDRKLVPDGDPEIDLSIIVDTVKPELDFRIETDAAGRVVCRWRATDKNLATNTMRIFYQPIGNQGTSNSWTQVPIQLAGTARGGVYADQIAWWPETSERSLNVAVEIKDIAGNAVQLTRQIQIGQTGWKHKPQSTAQITDRPPQNVAAQNNGWAPPGSTTGQRQSIAGRSQANGKGQVNGKVNRHSNQAFQSSRRPDQNTQQVSNANSAAPPKMVCKDGVCKLVHPNASQTDSRSNRVANLTNGNQWNFDQAQSETRMSNASADQQPNLDPSVDQTPPPVPDGYDPATSNVAQAITQPNAPPSQSQLWPSDVENWIPKNKTNVGSTIGSDSRVAPHPFPHPLPRQSVTKVSSNAPTMVHRGDQVIGQSSTMGESNQYRGLNSQDDRPIPKSTLLPGVAGIPSNVAPQNHPANPSLGRINQANRRPRQQLSETSGSNPRSFSQAGFGQPGAATDIMPPRGTDAPIQIIGSKRFRLDYGIDSIDPSGVARVDLWLTRDGGRSWQSWGSDPDNQSPFPVEIQEEGRYGFRIVVHSKDGLTGQGPSSGDDADMWVLVDTQSPLTRITSVPYGRGNEAGRLVINYSVSDQYLTLRPIALAYSQNPQGPWNSIGQGLRNEGRFVWKPTPDVPDRIFLRIDALDKAGNVGSHMLSQAIDVSGLVPRGTIHGVVPVGQRSPSGQ